MTTRTIAAVVTVALCAIAVMPAAADFSNCYTRITPQPDLSIITVSGRCSWKTFDVIDPSVKITGRMTVAPSNQSTACVGSGYCGMSLKPPYIASTTYSSTATFTASQLFAFAETTVTDITITPEPTNPHSTCPGCCYYSPIVISIRGTYRLTSVDDGVSFDIDADGVEERVAWTARGSDLAFLALDRNHNGRIDGGAELFGDVAAANGWVALAQLDANGDGNMDANDAAWSALLLWYDRDHNGRSTPNELSPVGSSEIIAISTSYRESRRRDQFGNLFLYVGEIELPNERRKAYDIYFRGEE